MATYVKVGDKEYQTSTDAEWYQEDGVLRVTFNDQSNKKHVIFPGAATVVIYER